MDSKDIMALRDLALSDRHCEFGSRDILNLVEAFVQQEAVASQARADGERAGLEKAAKVAKDRADICLDAVRKIEAGEPYRNIPNAFSAEQYAYMEALHIERTIRAIIEECLVRG